MGNVFKTLIAFILICLCIYLRFWNLEADPPVDLSASGGYFADEGYWTHNARNKILFGISSLDEWNNKYVSPLLHLASYASFSVFGVTLFSARLVPVILSIMSILMLFLSVFRDRDYKIGLLVLIFLGFHYVYLVYNRIAIVETPATFLLVTVFFFFRGSTKLSLFLAGFLTACAYLTKTTLIFCIPVGLIAIVLYQFGNQQENRSWFKHASYELFSFTIGLSIPLLIWFFFIYLPHGELLTKYNDYYRKMLLPSSFIGFVKEIISQRFHIFFNRTPVLLLISHLYVLIFFYEMLDRRASLKRSEIFIWLWYVCGIFFFSLFSYRPLRYYLPLVPAMVLMCSIFFHRLLTEGYIWIQQMIKTRRRLYVFLLWMLIPLAENAVLLIDRYVFEYRLLKPYLNQWPIIGIWYPGMFLIVFVGIFILVFLFIMSFRSSYYATGQLQKLTRIFMYSLIAVFLLVNCFSIGQWFNNHQFTVLSINQELAELPFQGVFTGQWAGELCLQTRHRVIPVFKDFVNDDRPFSRYPIRFVMLWEDFGHKDTFFRNFPEVANKMVLLRTFRIKNSNVYLFEIPS